MTDGDLRSPDKPRHETAPSSVSSKRLDEFRVERRVGVGCITAVGGFFSGGMIAVFVAKIVGWVTRCEPEQGLPACNWHVYMIVGALVGLVTLPVLAFWRLRGRSRGEPERHF